jgi:hypothetical protein
MTPNNPTVKLGNILNLVTRDEQDRLTYKHFIVAVPFDYRDLIEEVRREGTYKTEEVYERLAELLVERNLVLETESAVLDVGIVGRASEAVMAVYKDRLNDQARVVDQVVADLNQSCHTFTGPEGDLHLLKLETGITLGYVKIAVTGSQNVERWITLDIIGPPDSDFPSDLTEQIEATLVRYMSERFPDDYLALRAYVGRSDLARSIDLIIGENSCLPPKKPSTKSSASSVPVPCSPPAKSPFLIPAPVITVRRRTPLPASSSLTT